MAHATSLVHQWSSAAGYLAIFLMPALLVAGAAMDRPYLAVGIAFTVLPLMRVVFGRCRDGDWPPWNERVATVLHALPVVYVVVLTSAVSLIAARLWTTPAATTSALIGLGLSLWITLLFGLCPAHELLHRRARGARWLGATLSGLVGYPALALEHAVHHGRPGNQDLAEWPRHDEPAWRFALRRTGHVYVEFFEVLRAAGGMSLLGSRRTQAGLAAAGMAATAGLFLSLGGNVGLALYLAAATGVTIGMQLITYLQHWALADKRWVADPEGGWAWEDDCRFQAWITLHISFHQRHHQNPITPFYQLGLHSKSPRLPAGYIIMLLLSLVPPLWRRAMQPALEAWQLACDSGEASPPNRRLTCFGLHRYAKRSAQSPVDP